MPPAAAIRRRKRRGEAKRGRSAVTCASCAATPARAALQVLAPAAWLWLKWLSVRWNHLAAEKNGISRAWSERSDSIRSALAPGTAAGEEDEMDGVTEMRGW